MSKPYKNHSGIIVDELEFLKLIGSVKNRTLWELRCSCGKIIIKDCAKILNGKGNKSCGCLSVYGRSNRKPFKEVIIRSLFRSYSDGAKKRNLSFNIDNKMFSDIIFRNCKYCGVEPLQKRNLKNNFILYNGIDRVDSSVGYEKDNIVPCCMICNRAKRELTIIEFYKYIKRLIKHNLKTKTNE